MRAYKFSQVKLQFIELIDENPTITKAASELALHLMIRHLKRNDGTVAITDQALGKRIGWNPEKVSRAVQVLSRTDLFEIKRGRWLRATEYALTEGAWSEATRRRNAAQKIADLHPKATPEKSLSSSGNFQSSTPEESPPSKEKEKEETGAATRTFVQSGHYALQRWQVCLEQEGFPPLNKCAPELEVNGELGRWLPDLWPAARGSSERAKQLRAIRLWLEQGHENQRDKRNAG